VELVVAPAEGPDLQPVGQADALEVALVLTRLPQTLSLFLCPAQQGGADPRALEDERDGRAEGTRANDRCAANLVSTRPGDGGRLGDLGTKSHSRAKTKHGKEEGVGKCSARSTPDDAARRRFAAG
jgi:hypothetical protein